MRLPAYVVMFVALMIASAVAADAGAPAEVVPDAVIYPTGTSVTDRANLQIAVNAGGTVLLKATSASGVPTAFEFGSGRVLLTQDVTILGETVNGHMTTIHRGNQPFRSVFGKPVKSAIRGVHFDGPTSAAVLLTFSRGFEFTDNVVTDVIGAPFFGFSKGQAVWVTEGTIRGAVVGTILIANNVVERVFADLSYGIALASLDASAKIIGNTFRDTKDTGILVVLGSQPVWIEDNLILGGSPFPGFRSAGNGIFTGQGAGPLYIRRNTVVCDNPLADGIALSGIVDAPDSVPGSSVLEKNDVTMHGSLFGGITIYGQVAPSLITNNNVAGDGAYALDISPFMGDEVTESTVFRGNNISHFHSTIADVFLDYVARDTVLVGNSGTVIDNGADNRITGFSPMRGGAGPEVQAAQQQKRELLQTLHSLMFADETD